MKLVRLILFFYALCMTILGIVVMKPNGVGGCILSVLWILSIAGLHSIKLNQNKDE